MNDKEELLYKEESLYDEESLYELYNPVIVWHAKKCIQCYTTHVWEEDSFGEPYICGYASVYVTSDNAEFWDDYDEALSHQCWLIMEGY